MVKNHEAKKAHFPLIILLLVLIISTQPFYLWNVKIEYFVVSTIFIYVLYDFACYQNPKRMLSFLLLSIFYLTATFHTYHVNIFASLLYFFLPLLFYFVRDEHWIYVYKKYLLFYTITLVPSLVVYFLVVWGGIDLPHTIIPPLNEAKSYNYLAYPFLVVPDTLLSLRFMGYYDEAGVIGTISGTLFLINKCDLKKWENWILLISGIFSFSLFFYLLILVYVLLFGSLKTKLLSGTVFAVVVFYLIGTDNPLNNLIFERLNMDNSESLYRLTRTDMYFDDFYNRFINSDMLWFGYGNTYTQTVVNTSGASYKFLIVDFGIIMFMVYIVALVIYYSSFKLKFKQILLLIFLMMANVYQRPFIFSLAYIFLLVSPPSILKAEENI